MFFSYLLVFLESFLRIFAIFACLFFFILNTLGRLIFVDMSITLE